MADPETASYRLLSFKYQPFLNTATITPATTNTFTADRKSRDGFGRLKGKAVNESSAAVTTTTTTAEEQDQGTDKQQQLPVLSFLMASLQVDENTEDATAAATKNEEEENKTTHTSSSTTMTTTTTTTTTTAEASQGPTPVESFHHFGQLPAELRLKIWHLCLLPRVVELRPTRPNYAADHDDGRRPEWQSGCTNPAILAVCTESRDIALAHFRIAFPLASIISTPTASSSTTSTSTDPTKTKTNIKIKATITNTTTPTDPNTQTSPNPFARYASLSCSSSSSTTTTTTNAPSPFQTLATNNTFLSGDASTYNFRRPSADSKAKLLRRVLYIAPDHDTVCILGQHSDIPRLTGVMRSFRHEDPLGVGIKNLGLSVKGWGWAGSAMMLRQLSSGMSGGVGAAGGWDLLFRIEQLVLFMYAEQQPPPAWQDRGTSGLQAFTGTGNRCELVQCEEANPSYRWWAAGKGKQFWDREGGMIKIGENAIRVMELEFQDGW